MNAQEYLAIERASEGRHEYWGDRTLEIPSGSREHCLISGNVAVELIQQLDHAPSEVYQTQMRVKVPLLGVYLYPDVAATCDDPRFEDIEFDTLLNPCVVVETLSPLTELWDRGKKFEHYRLIPSLREYVLISQDHVLVEKFAINADGQWALRDYRTLEDILVLDSISCQIKLSDIYGRIDFSESDEPEKSDSYMFNSLTEQRTDMTINRRTTLKPVLGGLTPCRSPRLLSLVRFVVAIVLFAAAAEACNIPVFRFALERWKPDSCEVVVFYNGALSAVDQTTVEELERASLAKDGLANLNVIRCDLTNNKDEELNDLWLTVKEMMATRVPANTVATTEKSEAKLAMLVGRSLKGRGTTINHWVGSLQDAKAAGLVESPIRSELTKRLQAGDAIVWLVLKSSDDQKMIAVRDLLKTQCEELPNKVELPEGIGLPGSELYSEVPLLLQFSVLEIDPSDLKEQYLVRQLKGFHANRVADDEPLIVPVFGRGRALEVIPAAQLNADLMHDLTEFLCGACSCQVKEQNPGFDLLLSTNWNAALFGEDSEGPPPEAAAGNGQNKGTSQNNEPELVPIPSGRKRTP